MPNLMKKYSLKTGFTLIELLVVIAIISVLSSIVLTQTNKARAKVAVSSAKTQVRQLRNAIALLALDTGKYPMGCVVSTTAVAGLNEIALNAPCVGLTEAPVAGVCISQPLCSWTSADINNWHGPYIGKIPNDPWGNPYYFDTDFWPFRNCPTHPSYLPNGQGGLPVVIAIVSYGPNTITIPPPDLYDCDDIYEPVD